MKYSVVSPVYNSAATLEVLTLEIEKVFAPLGVGFEVIFVDDSSDDNSWETLLDIAQERDNVRVFRLSRNFGQLAATTCGIHQAGGECIITTDCDLQYHPRDMRKLIKEYETGNYKIVFGKAQKRHHSFWHRLRISVALALFNYVALPRYRKTLYFSGFKILDRRLFFDDGGKPNQFNLYYVWELPPNSIKSVPVSHYPGPARKTSYRLFKRIKHFEVYLRFAAAKLCRYSVVFTLAGLVTLWLSRAYNRVADFPYAKLSIVLLVLLAAAIVGLYFNKKRLAELRNVHYVIADRG